MKAITYSTINHIVIFKPFQDIPLNFVEASVDVIVLTPCSLKKEVKSKVDRIETQKKNFSSSILTSEVNISNIDVRHFLFREAMTAIVTSLTI